MRLLVRKMVLSSLFVAVFCAATVPDVRAQDGFIGEIRMFAGTFAPRGWMFCDGSLLPISSYSVLYSILGTTYGGDGRTTFALPNLSGRVPMGAGQGAGLSHRVLGERGGQEIVSLTLNNLPAHSHSLPGIQVSSSPATEQVAGTNGANTLAAPTVTGRAVRAYNSGTPDVTLNSGGGNSGNTGAGHPIDNVQPYAVINFIICVEGYAPSRP
ncbi:phage tail protein [Parapedobacter sp. ISTM3]|uniref:phage tail protein n=1 Tax=Parapedobacter sp. ISTM3 TaxID=2800130 RepID=UPI001905C108|nr:tail fiber protein [Parapedobacter sp. ISTM3]MBK1442483.1 phage tail protein [Parapedobacter sp. ISTM3]